MALDAADRLLEQQEAAHTVVPREIAWQEEADHEEHVPNGVEDDSKAKLDQQARKRTIQEMRDGVDDEDLEQYRRKRVSKDDPMAQLLGKDELVH